MFIGHYSAALVAAAHPESPRLGSLFCAAQLVDIGFFSFVIAGIENLRIIPGFTAMNALDLYDMPYTHSLVGALVWTSGFALWLRAVGTSWRGAMIGAAVVLSHWLLDLIVHVRDLTIAGAPPRLGLGLWNHPAIAIPLELGLITAAMLFYLRSTLPRRRSLAVPLLILFLAAVQAFNWLSPEPRAYDISIPLMALFAYGAAIVIARQVDTVRIRGGVIS